MGGRLVLHLTKRTRAARHGTRKLCLRSFEAASVEPARRQWSKASVNGVGRSALRVGREDNRAKSAVRACSVVGRLVLHVTKRARAARHGVGTSEHVVLKLQPTTWCGVGKGEPRPTSRGGECRQLAAKTTAPSPQRSARSMGGRLVLHGVKRARAARHRARNLQIQRFQARIRRPGAVSVERSRDQGHEMERVASWPQRQPRQVRRAREVCGRSAGSACDDARTGRTPRN